MLLGLISQCFKAIRLLPIIYSICNPDHVRFFWLQHNRPHQSSEDRVQCIIVCHASCKLPDIKVYIDLLQLYGKTHCGSNCETFSSHQWHFWPQTRWLFPQQRKYLLWREFFNFERLLPAIQRHGEYYNRQNNKFRMHLWVQVDYLFQRLPQRTAFNYFRYYQTHWWIQVTKTL